MSTYTIRAYEFNASPGHATGHVAVEYFKDGQSKGNLKGSLKGSTSKEVLIYSGRRDGGKCANDVWRMAA